ncbi:hypothetical protein JNA64_17970 [Pseudomonas stutzeri]|uniref:hypothetical protein n=1 Tax=Stutzerimonas stutzeri TaxID=316 RepID=UPI001F52059B|nr:hypothetical protein [Stutzerimonas stutzeri]MCI0919048.1 hypothetical protein [Stutzerimonas stutzeri]
MPPDFQPPRRSAGFGLVAALFLMIVVALVIMAMAHLSATQHGTGSLAIQQARAYQAARAGLEWGIAQAIDGGVCPTASPSLMGSGLAEFTVGVTCKPLEYTEGAGSVAIYQLTATAQNGAPGSRPDYAYRQLTAVVER